MIHNNNNAHYLALKVQYFENNGTQCSNDKHTLIHNKAILLSSAAKPGTHFLENNKITGVFTTLKL